MDNQSHDTGMLKTIIIPAHLGKRPIERETAEDRERARQAYLEAYGPLVRAGDRARYTLQPNAYFKVSRLRIYSPPEARMRLTIGMDTPIEEFDDALIDTGPLGSGYRISGSVYRVDNARSRGAPPARVSIGLEFLAPGELDPTTLKEQT